MKIKLFSNHAINNLEAEVNKFLETVSKVIDIKYSGSDKWSDVMIIYEEEKAAE